MHSALLALIVLQSPVAQLDRLAQARDAGGLERFTGPEVRSMAEPFGFLKRNGVYDVGRLGWRAHYLGRVGTVASPQAGGPVSGASPQRDSGEGYIVFSTPLTSQDIGEQVFEWNGSRLTRYVPEQDALGHRIERQAIEVWFDVPKKAARLEATVQFRRVAGAPQSFLVRMSPHYRVSSVKASNGANVRFAQAGGVVCLPTGRTERFSYKLSYAGVVNLPQYAGSIGPTEAMLTNDYWYPMIARQPSPYDLTVHAPKEWIVVGQGELVSTRDVAGERITTYRMDLPVVYWSLSAAPYATVEQTLGARRYAMWSLTLSQEAMRTQIELFHPVIEYFSQALAPYPFSRWGAVDSPNYGGGALEAYSFATYGTGWLPDEDAHEPAHTWWGGMINNTYLKSLWNESFANFSVGLYRREGPIGNPEEKRLAFIQDALPSQAFRAAPLSASGAALGGPAGALGYGKGAMVLQMLEAELGTELMLRTLREWLRTHPAGVPGDWEHYERVVHRMTDQSYAWFFDQWVRRPGWPEFEIESVGWHDGQVRATAKFTGGSPWRLKCDVLLQYDDGARQYTTCRIASGPRGEAAEIVIPTPRKPALVSFDPWRRLLRNYNDNETPVQLDRQLRRARKYVDPERPDWLQGVGASRTERALPSDLDGWFLVGHPDSLSLMKALCAKVKFEVSGNKLAYDGTTVDLDAGGALAVVELGGGKRCVIGLGKTVRQPSFGRARLVVFDRYGRFLRGETDPKTEGFLTFQL